MKILVTGGAGFIGSHLVDRYVELGHEVAVIDNFATGLHRNLNRDARLYETDITAGSEVANVLQDFRPDVVSHHASHLDVTESVADPRHDASVNIVGALNVLLAAIHCGSSRFIFASSGGAVYGEPGELPVRESHPAIPASPYGLTKLAFEHYLRIYSALSPITTVVLRYANVYGPRQTGQGEAGVVAVFTRRLLGNRACTIYGDGSMTRDYVYVGDVVAANVAALTRGDGAAINIGTGLETTTQAVFDQVRECISHGPAVPNYEPERPGEVCRIKLDCSLAERILGWQPHVSFDSGIATTVAWHKSPSS